MAYTVIYDYYDGDFVSKGLQETDLTEEEAQSFRKKLIDDPCAENIEIIGEEEVEEEEVEVRIETKPKVAGPFKELTITRKVTISAEDVDCILDSAGYGIGYWASSMNPVGEFLGGYASDQISRGGSIEIVDEDDTKHILTPEKFYEGLTKFLQEQDIDCIDEEGRVDSSNLDSEDADMIVQLALFGEIVYG